MRLAALVWLLLLAGCSSTTANTALKPADLVSFKESASFTVRWHRNIGGMGRDALQPALTADAVYAANVEGELFRLERTSGKQLWRADAGFAITGGVGAGGGLVVVAGGKGEVAAFTEDGKLSWRSKVSSEVLSAPQIADGIVVVRSGDSHIAGLNVKDGSRQWLYERSTPSLVVRNHAGVVISHGVVYVGFAGGKLVAIALANGSVKWETILSQPRGNTELERISDITSLPEVDDEVVCAVSFQGRAGCFDIAQGSMLWSRELSSDKGMSLLRKYLYVTDAQGAVQAMDKNAGSSLWKNDQLYMRSTSAPYALENYVVVGDYDGYLHALKRDDGSFAARIKTDGSAILNALIEMDNGLLLQTQDGGLYSVSIN